MTHNNLFLDGQAPLVSETIEEQIGKSLNELQQNDTIRYVGDLRQMLQQS